MAGAMSETRSLFENLLEAVRDFHARTPALAEFAAWPGDLVYEEPPVAPVDAISLIEQWRGSDPVHLALQAAARHAEWRQTYSEAEVGRAFLQRYGYIELYGPQGVFRTWDSRGFVAFWAEGLVYPWHYHEAEEIYAVVSGGGLFEARGGTTARLGPGQTYYHESNQPHALTLEDEPILALALWRGGGLDGHAVMGGDPDA